MVKRPKLKSTKGKMVLKRGPKKTYNHRYWMNSDNWVLCNSGLRSLVEIPKEVEEITLVFSTKNPKCKNAFRVDRARTYSYDYDVLIDGKKKFTTLWTLEDFLFGSSYSKRDTVWAWITYEE